MQRCGVCGALDCESDLCHFIRAAEYARAMRAERQRSIIRYRRECARIGSPLGPRDVVIVADFTVDDCDTALHGDGWRREMSQLAAEARVFLRKRDHLVELARRAGRLEDDK